MKIDIITMHSVKNFGSALQTYATQYILKEKMHHNVEIIDYRAGAKSNKKYFFDVPKDKFNNIKKYIYILYKLPVRIINYIIFEKFLRKNINLTSKVYSSYDELCNNVPKADIYMTGSDQTWTPVYGFEPAYYLAFTKKNKIAYAASFGQDKLDEEQISKVAKLLKEYKAISVREKTGLEVLKTCGINDATCVLDPTMLLNINDWKEIYKQSKLNLKEKYLLIYMLGNVPTMYDYAQEIAKIYGYKIVKIGWDYKKNKKVDKLYRFKSPVDFVYLFKNAQYVVTNSFHGTAFAINFNKQFITIPPTKNNVRFESILNLTNLQNRNMYDGLQINEAIKQIDYDIVNPILQKEKEKSIQFLEDNIKEN